MNQKRLLSASVFCLMKACGFQGAYPLFLGYKKKWQKE
jgi:hypothetical protein